MPGTRTEPTRVRDRFTAYSSAAVTASQYLSETVIESHYALGAVKVYAETAGSGTGNTVVTLLKNGAAVFAAAGDRPTLAAASTGEFANVAPAVRWVVPGDRLAWQVAGVPTVAGHARLFATVSLEDPRGNNP